MWQLNNHLSSPFPFHYNTLLCMAIAIRSLLLLNNYISVAIPAWTTTPAPQLQYMLYIDGAWLYCNLIRIWYHYTERACQQTNNQTNQQPISPDQSSCHHQSPPPSTTIIMWGITNCFLVYIEVPSTPSIHPTGYNLNITHITCHATHNTHRKSCLCIHPGQSVIL